MINLLHVGAFCCVWVLFSRTVLPRPAILWAVRRRKAPTRPDSHPHGSISTHRAGNVRPQPWMAPVDGRPSPWPVA